MRIFTPAGPQVFLFSPEPLQSCEKRRETRKDYTGSSLCRGWGQQELELVSSPPKRKSKTPFVGLDPGE